MGSSYFYLEFLLAWLTLLQARRIYRNPCILSVEYSLVPDAIFPTQLKQALAAYRYAAAITPNVTVAGDSAGGTLTLTLLLHLRSQAQLSKPKLAVLISPWVTIVDTQTHRNTASDYLDVGTLHQYGTEYLGNVHTTSIDKLAEPGHEHNTDVWSEACPENGFVTLWGQEEMLAEDIRGWVNRTTKAGLPMRSWEIPNGVHAWPVAALYLGDSKKTRLSGLEWMVEQMVQASLKKD